jgi:hypothetical protein
VEREKERGIRAVDKRSDGLKIRVRRGSVHVTEL